MSLKNRIREAQIEAAKRLSSDARRDGDDEVDATNSRDAETDAITAPSVEEIRLALLRKTANGKTIE